MKKQAPAPIICGPGAPAVFQAARAQTSFFLLKREEINQEFKS